MRSLGGVGAVVTNMVMGVAGSGGTAGSSAAAASQAHGGPASAAAPSPSLTRQDSTATSASAAAGAGAGSTEKQDTLIMDTKLKIIEILQVHSHIFLFPLTFHSTPYTEYTFIRTMILPVFLCRVFMYVYVYLTICCAYAMHVFCIHVVHNGLAHELPHHASALGV